MPVFSLEQINDELRSRRQKEFPYLHELAPPLPGALASINLTHQIKVFPPELFLNVTTNANGEELIKQLWQYESELFSQVTKRVSNNYLIMFTQRGWHHQDTCYWNKLAMVCLAITARCQYITLSKNNSYVRLFSPEAWEQLNNPVSSHGAKA